jgi:hypothetical protein
MKTIIKFTLLFSLIASLPASASSWNFTTIGTDETRYFFDADTVLKGKDNTVTVWVKSVQTRKADARGSWATAFRWKMNCFNQTIQGLGFSTYDREGNFLSSSPVVTESGAIPPDSIGAALLAIACAPSFPNDAASKKYFKLADNDVYKAAKSYADFVESQKDPAPK